MSDWRKPTRAWNPDDFRHAATQPASTATPSDCAHLMHELEVTTLGEIRRRYRCLDCGAERLGPDPTTCRHPHARWLRDEQRWRDGVLVWVRFSTCSDCLTLIRA